jgi:maltose alpha-D-glucosyltransferase/alpha-amylase
MGANDEWYENSFIYGIDVERFADSDGDGRGDFGGLIERLDYLSDLGVDCLWLLPFYPTPDRDNGYDVTDYCGVDDRVGSFGDFAAFLEAVEDRGIRVLVDLPLNHTSDQHPWFRKAREGHDRYRDYYVWTDDPESADVGAEQIFPGQERSLWSYDERADAYYFHRFYDFEPELNFANPDVREEARKIMRFWLRLGVDGFRLDAANHMVEPGSVESAEPEDPHGVLREFRAFVTERRSDAVLLGEVDEPPDHLSEFFGDGDELHMLFNFLLDNYLFLGLARERPDPIIEGVRLLPPTPPGCQWANFLRNLDELDLERLTEPERRDVFEAFAPEEDKRIFGRGIRRRLAPMLDGDQRRIELSFSLLFSLPGSPVLVYGDEIGMGDDLSLHGRTAVRTPMQWSDESNAGFSDAPPDDLTCPVIDDGEFGYERVNVADQRDDPDSLLGRVRRLVRARQENPEFGSAGFDLVETDAPEVMVHRCASDENAVVAIHNLSDESVEAEFELPGSSRLVDVFENDLYEPVEGGTYEFDVEPYGHRWLRVGRAVETSGDDWEEVG